MPAPRRIWHEFFVDDTDIYDRWQSVLQGMSWDTKRKVEVYFTEQQTIITNAPLGEMRLRGRLDSLKLPDYTSLTAQEAHALLFN